MIDIIMIITNQIEEMINIIKDQDQIPEKDTIRKISTIVDLKEEKEVHHTKRLSIQKQ